MVVTLGDGEVIEHEELRKASDFDLDWRQIDELLLGIASANAIDPAGIAPLAEFARGSARGRANLGAVLDAFRQGAA